MKIVILSSRIFMVEKKSDVSVGSFSGSFSGASQVSKKAAPATTRYHEVEKLDYFFD